MNIKTFNASRFIINPFREGYVNGVIDSIEDSLSRELDESEIEQVDTYVANALSDAEFA